MAEGGRGRDPGRGGSKGPFKSSYPKSMAGSSVSSCWTSVSMADDRRHGIPRRPWVAAAPVPRSGGGGSQVSEGSHPNRAKMDAQQRAVQQHADLIVAQRFGTALQQEDAAATLRKLEAKAKGVSLSDAEIHQPRGGSSVVAASEALAAADARRREQQEYDDDDERNDDEETPQPQDDGGWGYDLEVIPVVEGDPLPQGNEEEDMVNRVNKLTFMELEDEREEEKRKRKEARRDKRRMLAEQERLKEQRAQLSDEERALEERLARLHPGK